MSGMNPMGSASAMPHGGPPGTLPHAFASPFLAGREREYLHPDILSRAYADPAFAQQVGRIIEIFKNGNLFQTSSIHYGYIFIII